MGKAWILVGMMGAGKSAIGRSLSERSGRDFLDTDAMLQLRLGRTIAQIFQIYGEPAFRDHETSLLKSIEPAEVVLSTGGGIVLRPENWDEMRRLGTTVYLEASLETLVRRLQISKKKRPLLQTENWEERLQSIYEARRPIYEQADLRFSVDQIDLEPASDRLFQWLSEVSPS